MNIKEYREKVIGCWLGKVIGGTLGAPYEGCDGPMNLDFYNPVPDHMIPNDDLDLQVLWACVLDKMEEPVVDRSIFSAAWLNNVNFPWDEYGVAIRNLRNNIKASFSGSYDNWFTRGMGGAIRSEIWACLAPGKPELAAAYAYEDACVDHDGDGIWAEVFLAALESMAFVENNIEKIINEALKQIPDESLLKKALQDTVNWANGSDAWLSTREKILEKYGHENFTDVVMNLCFMVLGLLAGKGDFSKSICITVNCGRDADCTTATVGAVLGIIAPDSIEEKWLKPIGRNLVINKEITGIEPPETIDEFTDLVIRLRERIGGKFPPQCVNSFDTEEHQIKVEAGFVNWFAQDNRLHLHPAPQMPENTKILNLPGTKASIKISEFEPDKIMLLKYQVNIDKKRTIKIMFNTHDNCRVWVDGKYVFGRESGRMAPSFHRVPVNQSAVLELETGRHEILAGIAPSSGRKEIEWVIGLGDAETNQWLNEAFK